jgi:CUB/sushi domain-containing protein
MVRPLLHWQLEKYRHLQGDNKVIIGPMDEVLNNVTVMASYESKNRRGREQHRVNATVTLRLGEKDVEILLNRGYHHKQFVQAVLGRRVKVSCFQVKGSPSPHLTLYKQQTTASFSIVPQEKYVYASGCLFMIPVTKQDSGSYQFAFSNCYAETYAEFVMDVVDVDCGPLPTPENGAISGDETILGSVLQFHCFKGYNLRGSHSRECQRSGQWTGITTSCEAVDCEHPPLLANGHVLAKSTVFGSVAQFVCLDGYRLSGDSSLVCEADAKWRYNLPWCERVCSHLESIENGLATVDIAVNGTASFSCNVGYNLFGSSTRKCQPNGIWDGQNAYCQIVDCGNLNLLTNGNILFTNGTTTYGSYVEIFCNTGYQLTGSKHRLCQANGSWSGQLPSCSIVVCGPIEPPQHGTVSVHNTTYLSLVNISCDLSYLLVGLPVRKCQADGKWSGAGPVCLPDPCFLNPCLNGGTCSPSLEIHEDSTKFHCNCTSLFDGPLCETVLATGCELVPCFPGVACTDLANGSFMCDSCPSGLVGDGIDCVTNNTQELVVVVPLDADALTSVHGCNVSVIMVLNNDTELLFFETISGDNSTFSVPRGETFVVTGEAPGYLSTSCSVTANPDESQFTSGAWWSVCPLKSICI